MSAIFPECPICFEALDHSLVASYCGHIFHQECLNTWMTSKNSMKCPICRRDSSISLKLVYDIKFSSGNGKDGEGQPIEGSNAIQSTQEILKQNKKLTYQNDILKAQIEEMKAKQEGIQIQIDESIKEFVNLEKASKEYKNKALVSAFKLSEAEEQCAFLKEELDKCHERFVLLDQEIKEKNETIEANKTVSGLLNKNSKDASIRDTVKDLIDKNDNGRALNEYIFILQQRIEALQEENDQLKKKTSSASQGPQHREPLMKKMDTSTLITMIGNPINSKKRKFDEFLSEKSRMSNLNENCMGLINSPGSNSKQNTANAKEATLSMSQNNVNSNTIRLFNNPFNQKKGISLINPKK